MKKKSIIILLILAAVAGGFFYFWEVWLPAQIEKEQQKSEEKTQPPTLFGKEDYKIEEREDGKYIVVEKVGLTAKVPEGWRAEYKRTADIEPQYWIALLSPDAEIFDILTKGCGISITCRTSEKDSQSIENKIKTIRESGSKLVEGPDGYKYEYEITTLEDYVALKGTPAKDNKFNKFIKGESIDIVLGENKILSLDSTYPPSFESKCYPVWEKFLKDIIIE